MFDIRHIGLSFLRSVLFPFLKIFILLAFFHAVRIRLSEKYLLYSLASVFEMVSSPAFNVSMCIWSLPSTSHDVISGASLGSVWIMVLYALSYSSM